MLIFIQSNVELDKNFHEYGRRIIPKVARNQIVLDQVIWSQLKNDWIKEYFGHPVFRISAGLPEWYVFHFDNLDEAMHFKLKWT